MTRQRQQDTKGKADGPRAKPREPLTDGGPKTGNSSIVQETLDKSLCNIAKHGNGWNLRQNITDILRLGANPDATNEEGRTPVMELADRYAMIKVEMLGPGTDGPTTSDNEMNLSHIKHAIRVLVEAGASGETSGKAVEALRAEMGLE